MSPHIFFKSYKIIHIYVCDLLGGFSNINEIISTNNLLNLLITIYMTKISILHICSG